jgi:WD40 repeat protein
VLYTQEDLFLRLPGGKMASIFISYSSRDERAAEGLQTWLLEHTHEVILRSRTKKQEQGAFEGLKAAFQGDIDRVDVVIFLVTPFWQASRLCQWELETASSSSKKLVAVLEAPSTIELSSRVAIADMTKSREAGFDALRDELQWTGSNAATGSGKGASADIGRQGAAIADHAPKKRADGEKKSRAEKSSENRQAGVNDTLKKLRSGIRWSAIFAWLKETFKLRGADADVKTDKAPVAPVKKASFKISEVLPLVKGGSKWVIADKMRVAGAAFLAFIFATALIGLVSDRTIGGKDAMRKELANVKKRQSLLLSRVSNHLRETGDDQTALLLALEAVDEAQEQDDLLKARDSLYSAWIKMQKNLVIKGHDNHVSGAMFSPDGQLILSSSWDRTARVWNLSSRKQVLALDQHDGFVNGAVYSPDQSLILTAALDNKARLYNARTGKLIRTLKGHSHDLTSAVFSRNGRRIVTASGDQTARVWDVAGGKTLKTFSGHKGGLEYADFSPDGKRIVTASADNMARILDVETGNELAVLKGHSDVVRSARFDPKGELIATGSQDKTIRLWGAKNGVLQRVLKGHKWAVLTVAFSPDGKRLVSASKDNTARVWDVQTGDLLLILQGHKGIVSQASFSPDGHMIVTASGDGTIRLWPLTTSDKDLVNKARHTATKCLTLAQRKKYFLSDTPPKWCIKLKKRPYNK